MSAAPAPPSPKPLGPRRGRYVCWILFAGAAATASFVGFHTLRDAPPTSYEDLAVSDSPPISPENNLYVALRTCAETFSKRGEDEPAAPWIARNASTIQAILEVDTKQEYESPVGLDDAFLQSHFEVAALIDFWHECMDAEPDPDRAVDLATRLLEVGIRVHRGARSTLDLMLASRVSRHATSFLVDSIHRGPLHEKQYRSVVTALASRSSWRDDVDRVLRYEFRSLRTILSRAAELGEFEHLVLPGSRFELVPAALILKPNRTLEVLADEVRYARDHLARESEWIAVEEPSLFAKARAAIDGNLLGHEVSHGYRAYLLSAIDFVREHECRLILLEVTAACAAHRAAGGDPIATLSELSPTYLQTTPVDPYFDRPIEFDANRRVIRLGETWHSLLSAERPSDETPR